MRSCRRAARWFAAALACCAAAHAQQVPNAFPGAEGFGAAATGGRGGTVYHVTNLNDSGAGSFRDAVSQSNRIVVFDFGGYINLTSAVSAKSNLTILGQTAPGDGIGIKGAEVSFFGSSNDIVRFVRFRDGTIDPGYNGSSSTSSSSSNAINLGSTTTMIFDHVSAEFAAYNNVDASGADNLTFQNSIVASPIASQRFNFHWEGTQGTFANNIFVDGHNRSILAKGNAQFVNNVVYNFQAGFTAGNSAGNFSYDIVNNYFITGPSTSQSSDDYYQVSSNQSAYTSGNILDANKDGVLNGSADNKADSAVVLSAPWSATTASLPLLSTANALSYNVAHAGASLHYDQVDALMLQEVLSNGTSGRLWTSETQTGLGNGGFGTINDGTHIIDTNNNGIADAWETAHGLLLSDSTGYQKLNPLGYTMLEQYANELALANSGKVWSANGGEWNANAANWSGGVPVIFDVASVRGSGAGTNGLVNITSSVAALQLSIGGNGAVAGEKVIVTGGSVTIFDTITVGDQNNGILQINSGTVSAANVILGNTISGATYNGVLALSGGTLATSQIVLGGGAPGNYTTGGLISWSGGTIQASAALSIKAPATIGNGGAFLDTNGFSGVISGSLGGSGGLTKIGAGTLSLTGTNSYSGATTLKAGTVSIASIMNGGLASPIGAASNAASNLVLDGGTLQYTGTGDSTDRLFTLTQWRSIGRFRQRRHLQRRRRGCPSRGRRSSPDPHRHEHRQPFQSRSGRCS